MKSNFYPRRWYTIGILLLGVFSTFIAFGQNASPNHEYYGAQASELVPGATFVLTGAENEYPSSIKLSEESAVSVANVSNWLTASFDMPENVKFVKQESTIDELGFEQFKIVQTVGDYPIDRAVYNVQAKNGYVKSLNGDAYVINTFKEKPSLSEPVALTRALSHFGEGPFLWQIPFWEEEIKEHENDPNASYFPKGKLVVTNFGTDNRQFRLAYVFDIYALEDEEQIYVDAESGSILYTLPLASNCSSASVNSIFNGVQTIYTDKYTANDYRLRDDCQTAHVRVRDWNSNTDVSNTPLEIENTTNTWTTMDERFGGTVLWEARQSYWYFKNVHSRSSYDGSDGDIECYINAVFKDANGNFYTDNASMSFSGSRMKVGLGSSGTLANSWSSTDIIGHEFAHAVTGTSSGLVYQGESGALNESFSDIFGEMIENFSLGSNDWLMGDERTSGAIRDMSNPSNFNDPDTYLQTNWANTCNGCSDNGGVHTNSGVQNYWFFLVSQGGSGTNDNGNAYNVSGIGRTKASAIAFRNAVVKLSANSDYPAARAGSIEAAEDLYGACSNEVKQVTNAWYAVGVGNPYVDATLFAKINVSCNGENDGLIYVNTVGTPPYTFSWDDGPTTEDRSNLAPGTYTLTVTDATGCSDMLEVTITEPAVLTASISNESNYNGYNISCNGASDGSATVSPSGGTPPYSYLWDDPAVQMTATASGLSAGNYMVTVTDLNGCMASTNVNISEPPVLTASITNVSNYNGYNISCNGGSDGFATVSPGGGVPPYSYDWSDGQTTATATGLSAGYYSVTVTDANGCTEEDNVTLTEPDPLTIDAGPNQTVYYGYAPAECADISWSGEGGGVPPYTISWSDGGAQSHQVCPGISTTTYTVTIEDANGCIETDEVTICVIDVRCGKNLDKVEMCHMPPGNPDSSVTICVGYNAVAMHLAHGDMLAACGTDHSCDDEKSQPITRRAEPSFNLYPNPFSNKAFIEFVNGVEGQVNISVYNTLGQITKVLFDGNARTGVRYNFEIHAADASPGMNLIVVRYADGTSEIHKLLLTK